MGDELSVTCPNCGVALPEGLEACPECGALLAQPGVVEIEPSPEPTPVILSETLPPPPPVRGKGSATCLVVIFMLGIMAAGVTFYFLSR